ncbi:hypothetical protein [Pseudogemmobacter bohemicus]|uniref:hypothetical protein n=1 Tax=Pseudogemmobacter bohemicus TaxID=2250708 RepID=UPI000DD33C70|nr:hypothetical protein [Pseudogemmobacter bohemicus]
MALCLALILAPQAALRAEETGAAASDGPALAMPVEGELYIAGVYAGRIGPGHKLRRPPVVITLDRPGIATTLALTSNDPVIWEVSLTPGTPVPRVLLSQMAEGGDRSTVTVAGKPAVVQWRILPFSFTKEGEQFRYLVTRLPADFGFDRVADFQGSYEAPEEPFLFAGPGDDPRLKADYLAPLVQPEAVPEASRPLAFSREIPLPEVSFTQGRFFAKDSFRYTDANGATVTVPLSKDVPPVSWLVGAARDPETDRIYAVTYGGEGYLYIWDPRQKLWSALSMQGRDAIGFGFDSQSKTALVPLQQHFRRGGLQILRLDEQGEVLTAFTLPYDAFPGLTDVYDPENGQVPHLIVLGIAGGKAVLRTTSRRYQPGMRPWPGDGMTWRSYVFDIETGAVVLAAYENEGAKKRPE